MGHPSIAARQRQWNVNVAEKEQWLEEQKRLRLATRDPSIPELKPFYEGRSVLVTGGTGFLGKSLLEKLLRSVPMINKIYVIVRPKKNQAPQQRLQATFNTDLYDLVRKQDPACFEKVVAIAGDCSCKGLALSPEDRALLQREVSVVYHGAATVRFDDPLKSALLLNTRGTNELLELSKGMTNLKSFVHISTTYCNTNQPISKEEVYPTPYDWRKLIKIAEVTPNTELQPLVKKIIGFQPNTYTFTKQLAEKVVDDARGEIPVVIVRPSVVTFTTHEPFRGWSDNVYGPTGFCMGILKGLVRGFYIDPEVNLKTVPVDAVAKVIITSAWLTGTNQKLNGDPQVTDVLNCTVEGLCDATYKDMFFIIDDLKTRVRPTSLRAPRIYATKSMLYYRYKMYTSHIPFAFCADLLLRILGRKPMVMKMARTIHNVNMALAYFMFQNFMNSIDLVYKCMAWTTDPDFQNDLKFDWKAFAMEGAEYAYKNVLREEQAGPYRQTILEVVHFIQHTIKNAFFLWLGYKFILQRFI